MPPMPSMLRVARRAFVAGAALLLSLPFAQSAAAAEATAAMLAGPCASCHGTDGRSPGAIPPIAGAPFAVLKAQLDAYRTDEIPGATVMNRIAKGLTPTEIETLARHFSALKK